ncbi:MAG: hypothetical protein IJR90_04545 [Clostridia bacterium]|nr:hypothetical protein [Clostridia bacterium]
MKKTIIAILTAAILLVSFASCGQVKEDCYKLYADAEAKTSALTRYSAGVEMSLGVDNGSGDVISMVSRTGMDADLTASKYLQSITNTTSDGGSQSVTLYHEAGTTYFTDGYSSYKYAEDDASAMTSVGNVADFDIPEAAFESAKLTEADSVKTIELTASGQSMKSLCDSYLYPVGMITGSENAYDISDVSISLSVNKDGYLVKASFSFSAGFDLNGKKASAAVDAAVEYTDVSGKAPVNAPDGYQSYPDYDPNAAATDTDDDGMSEKDAEAIDAAFSLFEDDHFTKVANYDELYKQYCSEYGKETMDSIIELILAFGAINAEGN